MTSSRPIPLLIANWKMNAGVSGLQELDAIAEAAECSAAQVVVCPPSPLLSLARQREPRLTYGAQDCHSVRGGAHTGGISSDLLAELGASFVLVGHSEIRAEYRTRDCPVRAKAETAIEAGLRPVICIGEAQADYDKGETRTILEKQLREDLPRSGHFHIAYEPVWAIGSGRVPERSELAGLFEWLHAISTHIVGPSGRIANILYGGSVDETNAAGLLDIPNVGGLLIGNASLTAARLNPIIRIASQVGNDTKAC